MPWVIAAVVAVGACVVGALLIRQRAAATEAHLRRLAAMIADGSPASIERLAQHAHDCHRAGPGRTAAEAWYALGCALLNAYEPERATRAFQLACHAHPGLDTAALLAFACLKTRREDMPNLAKIVIETQPEVRRLRVPASRWEQRVLAGLASNGDKTALSSEMRALALDTDRSGAARATAVGTDAHVPSALAAGNGTPNGTAEPLLLIPVRPLQTQLRNSLRHRSA